MPERHSISRTAKQRGAKKRRIFDEIMDGLEALKAHREGRLTLRSYKVEPPTLPPVDPQTIRDVRERFHLSRALFARLLGLSVRTLEVGSRGAAIQLLWPQSCSSSFDNTLKPSSRLSDSLSSAGRSSARSVSGGLPATGQPIAVERSAA